MDAPASDGRGGKPTLSERLARELRAQILSGALEPGQRLNLDRMRESRSVSVSSLREAVTRLVADGLIDAEEHRGYRVAPVSLANLAEVTALRMAIEPMALEAAIENGGLDWETGVMAALYRVNRIRRDPGDPATLDVWEAAHRGFHLALIERCDMPLMLRFARVLYDLNDRYRRIVIGTWPNARNVTDEHTAIAEAAVARRGDEAAALLRAHLERTAAALRALLADRLPGKEPSGPGRR